MTTERIEEALAAWDARDYDPAITEVLAASLREAQAENERLRDALDYLASKNASSTWDLASRVDFVNRARLAVSPPADEARHVVTVVEQHDHPKVWTERAECSCGWVGPNRRRHTDKAEADGAAHIAVRVAGIPAGLAAVRRDIEAERDAYREAAEVLEEIANGAPEPMVLAEDAIDKLRRAREALA